MCPGASFANTGAKGPRSQPVSTDLQHERKKGTGTESRHLVLSNGSKVSLGAVRRIQGSGGSINVDELVSSTAVWAVKWEMLFLDWGSWKQGQPELGILWKVIYGGGALQRKWWRIRQENQLSKDVVAAGPLSQADPTVGLWAVKGTMELSLLDTSRLTSVTASHWLGSS